MAKRRKKNNNLPTKILCKTYSTKTKGVNSGELCKKNNIYFVNSRVGNDK